MNALQRIVLVLSIVLFSACSYTMNSTPYGNNEILLCVVNQSITPYRIYVAGVPEGSVYPGEKRILKIRTPQEIVDIIGTGLAGANPLRPRAVDLTAHEKWEWIIDNTIIFSEGSLQPRTRTLCD